MKKNSFSIDYILNGGIKQNYPVNKFCQHIGDTSKQRMKNILKRVQSAWFKKEICINNENPVDAILLQELPKRATKMLEQFSESQNDQIKEFFEQSSQKKFEKFIYRKIEVRFRIKSDEIFQNGPKLVDGWTSHFYDELAKTRFRCFFKVLTRYFTADTFNTPYLIISGICGFNECNRFLCIINDIFNDYACVEILSNNSYNESSHSSQVLRRQIRKSKREAIAQQVDSKTNTEIRNVLIKQENVERNSNGCIDFIASQETVRKIRQEYNDKTDLDKDDFMACKSLRTILGETKPTINNRTPQYIRLLSDFPFHVLWFCDTQIEILKGHDELCLFFDATGTVVRKSIM